jgi:NAD-dependent dihydropyrimidine dehydrogenase PreA subunit
MPYVTLNTDTCTACQNCLKACPMGVFAEKEGEIVVVEPNQCIICRACEATCPSDSIVVED